MMLNVDLSSQDKVLEKLVGLRLPLPKILAQK